MQQSLQQVSVKHKCVDVGGRGMTIKPIRLVFTGGSYIGHLQSEAEENL